MKVKNIKWHYDVVGIWNILIKHPDKIKETLGEDFDVNGPCTDAIPIINCKANGDIPALAKKAMEICGITLPVEDEIPDTESPEHDLTDKYQMFMCESCEVVPSKQYEVLGYFNTSIIGTINVPADIIDVEKYIAHHLDKVKFNDVPEEEDLYDFEYFGEED